MTQPWEAEHQVDAALAARLIQTQFPQFAGTSLNVLGVGWDNIAYLVDGRVVFRFPRRQIAVPLLESETHVLGAIASRLPLPVPRPTWLGTPAHGYPWPFVGYPMLVGKTACGAALSAESRVRAAKPLAEFLRVLHAVKAREAHQFGATGDTLDRTNVGLRAEQTRDRLVKLMNRGLCSASNTWPSKLIEEALATPQDEFEGSSLVHGDLYARHVLVDERDAPCGIIDWGDVHVGHPGLDLSLAYAFLPAAGRDVFFDHYGVVPESVAVFARFRALFSLVAIVHYGAEVGDAALVAEGQTGLGWLQQR